jgi:hypothetical protein
MDVLGLRSSKVNIQNQLLHNYVCLTMGGVEVVGRSGIVLNEGDPKGGDTCPLGEDPHDSGGVALQVEIPTAVAVASSPNPSMG